MWESGIPLQVSLPSILELRLVIYFVSEKLAFWKFDGYLQKVFDIV